MHIIVADDEAPIRRLLKRILSLEGYEVTEADCGLAAESAIRAAHTEGHPFDALVLDIHMPDKEGQELYADLEADHCRPPTLVITGDPQCASLAELKSCGCERVLEKPFSPLDVLQAIRDITS